MGFSSNGLPLGPNGSFPRQRIGNAGTVRLRPVRDIEGVYMMNEVAQLPTQEMEYSSVANAAKNHLLFGEVKEQSNMRKMGGGFQREMDRKRLMARPMPGHGSEMSGLGIGVSFKGIRKLADKMSGRKLLMKVANKVPGVKRLNRFANRLPGRKMATRLMGRVPGHKFVTNLGPRRMMGSGTLTGVGLGESRMFGGRGLGPRIGVGNSGRSQKGWLFRLFGTSNKQIPNYGLGSGRDQNF